MAARNGSPPSHQARVPAWKRLGLKLKYAKQDVGSDSPAPSNRITTLASSIGNGSQQHIHHDESPSSPPPKKRRTDLGHLNQSQRSVENRVAAESSTEAADEPSQPSPNHRPVEGEAEPPVASLDSRPDLENQSQSRSSHHHSPAHSKDTNGETRRKSVTFATDTKKDDGVSASTLSKDRTPETSFTDDTAASTVQTVTKKAKKRKKRASNDKAEPEISSSASHTVDEDTQVHSVEVPTYVTYLQHFHTDKSSWKFNKNKQNDLLKNLFNLQQLPSEHNEAIREYIAGLQGSAARQRVVDSATAVLQQIADKEDASSSAEDMEAEEARRAAYSSALRRHLERYESLKDRSNEYDDQQIEDMRQEAERGERAEALLVELLGNESSLPQQPRATTQLQQTLSSNQGPHVKLDNPIPNGTVSVSKRKRRKARTQASADDSSSSSSESESESERRHTSNRGPSTIHDALKVAPKPSANSPVKPSSLPKGTGRRKIFDDDFLDQVFPKKPSYHDTAPKRKAGEAQKPRGFAYTRGMREDESGSEDE